MFLLLPTRCIDGDDVVSFICPLGSNLLLRDIVLAAKKAPKYVLESSVLVKHALAVFLLLRVNLLARGNKDACGFRV
jgi:hypothetical protein